jgi:hypothetical protein
MSHTLVQSRLDWEVIPGTSNLPAIEVNYAVHYLYTSSTPVQADTGKYACVRLALKRLVYADHVNIGKPLLTIGSAFARRRSGFFSIKEWVSFRREYHLRRWF